MDIKELREQAIDIVTENQAHLDCSMFEDDNEQVFSEVIDQILSLDGLYMEVEGELPIIGAYLYKHEKSGYLNAQKAMLEAGYKHVRPTKDLVKEVKV